MTGEGMNLTKAPKRTAPKIIWIRPARESVASSAPAR